MAKALDHWNDSYWWRTVAFPEAIRTIHRYLPDSGLDLVDETWDNLIILDACRYDMFAEQSDLSGELYKRSSGVSNTPEFLRKNFGNRDLRDTVYVTANPQIAVHAPDTFYEVVNVWQNHWDDELHTVPPDVMAEETLAAYQRYPEKRLIAHFIQPHYPFIGEIGQTELPAHSGMELSKRLATGGEALRDTKSVWEQLYEDSKPLERVWTAYRENLEIALPHIEKLINEFKEYTVVTSDHGNALGERGWPLPFRLYGHPPGIRISALTDVPWLVTNTNNRKKIVPGESTTAEFDDQNIISERLSDLGYR